MLEGFVLSQALGFALILTRIAGFVVVSPFPGAYVSRTQRAGLAIAISWVASMFAPLAHVPSNLDLSLAMPAGVEFGCGVVMGCAFRFLYVTAEFLGQIVSQAIGLSMASVMNPTISGEDVALGRIVTLLAELLALGAGVHRTAIAYLLQSFRVLPVGVAISLPASSHVLVDLVIRSMTVGLRLAMPVVGVCLVMHVGLAMIARAAPALQILHVGLSVMLATGFLTLIAVLPDIGRSLLEHYSSLGRVLSDVLAVLRASPP